MTLEDRLTKDTLGEIRERDKATLSTFPGGSAYTDRRELLRVVGHLEARVRELELFGYSWTCPNCGQLVSSLRVK